MWMRSTHKEPRCYGARLYVGRPSGSDENFGTMELIDGHRETWDQVCGLVRAALGETAVQRMIPTEDTTDTTIPNCRCVYVLDGTDGWTAQNRCFGQNICITYRLPGAHPDEDLWNPARGVSVVKVADKASGIWYVTSMADRYGWCDAYQITQSNR